MLNCIAYLDPQQMLFMVNQKCDSGRNGLQQIYFKMGEEAKFAFVYSVQYNFIARCHYSGTRNVLWCQVHSSHGHV